MIIHVVIWDTMACTHCSPTLASIVPPCSGLTMSPGEGWGWLIASDYYNWPMCLGVCCGDRGILSIALTSSVCLAPL